MRLLTCYIAGFGCLIDQSFNFTNENPFVIYAPNGQGKSTFAVFIKAMFYGLEGRGKGAQNNERMRYKPWHSSNFGGWLVFEINGYTLRISRSFDEKSKTGDTFQITDETTGSPFKANYQNDGSDIGNVLFGINASTFIRTIYFPQDALIQDFSTDQIRQKLTTMLEGSPEDENYDSAIEVLKTKRTELKPFRGNTSGALANTQRKINNLQEQINSFEQDKQLASEQTYKLADINNQIDILSQNQLSTQQSIRKANQASDVSFMLARQKELQASFNESISNYKSASAFFENKKTTYEEIAHYKDLLNQVDELNKTNADLAEQISKNSLIGSNSTQQSTINLLAVALLVAGLLAIVIGIALFAILPSKIAPIAALLVGLAFILVSIAIKEAKGKEAGHLNTQAIPAEEELANNKQLILALESDIFQYIDGFSSKATNLHDAINEIYIRLNNFESAKTALTTVQQQYKEFKQAYKDILDQDSYSPGHATSTDIKTLKEQEESTTQKLNELLKQRSLTQAKLETLQASTERIANLSDELEDAYSTMRTIKENVELLDTTIDLLSKAKQSLSRNYLESISKSFNNHALTLIDNSGSVRIDEALSINTEDAGNFYGQEYMSSGTNDILTICMRLALADAIFENEKPFTILDDPFVNLDNDHTDKALQTLNQLAYNRQIIYMTCHSSRLPKGTNNAQTLRK